MPTAGSFTGNLIGIYIGSDLIGCTTNDSMSFTRNQIDASCKGSGDFGTFLSGSGTWTAQCDGNIQFDATYGFLDLFAAWKAKTELTLKWSTEVTGDSYITGTAVITQLDANAPRDEVATYSVTFSGKGEPDLATVAS